MPLGVIDGTLNSTLQCATNPLKHAVKGGKLAHRRIVDGNGHFTENTEHGALTHRVGFAFKTVVHRNTANRRLEQRELVRHEGVAVGEVLFVAEIRV